LGCKYFWYFGSNKKRKLELKKELLVLEFPEENGKLTTDEMSYRVNMQEELFKLYEGEKSYCHQKAHGKWLLEEDQYTAYFHIIANGRTLLG
jgi:hypothetical protein